MAVHVVQAGENLWGISQKYGVKMQTLINMNGLTTTSLVPGLALYLPDHLLPIRTYRMKKGDQLNHLSKQFNTELSYILSMNPNIKPNQLSIGQIISIPSPIKLDITTLGFIFPLPKSSIAPILQPIAKQLTYLAIVAYSFTEQGFALNTRDDTAVIETCHELNISPLLMIRNLVNDQFSADLVGNVLGNATYSQNLVASITNLARQRGFSGVSIDFEFIPPEHRNDFITFLSALKNALGNLLLHVNVHAKAADLPTNRIVGAYNYAAIGEIVDYMAVMTIDYGYPGGPPDPIAPIGWVEQVISYAISQMNPAKLQIAMALYGYDKSVSNNQTRALSAQGSQNQAITTGSTIQFDNTAFSPWYRYWRSTEEHIVWFEDIRSYIAKYRLIDLYQIAGTTYWQVSLSAPQNWAFVERNINVKKV
ncbi:MAG: glycoside hydrolase family 18 protein [Heyndrickxia sp.]